MAFDLMCSTRAPGIPASEREEIFVEFHQLHNPERDRRHGLGLGLAIVARLGAILRHDVAVVSHVGRGSRFSVTASLTTAPVARRIPASEIVESIELRDKHVLVVEDEVTVRKAMAGILETWGCHVKTADSGLEAQTMVDTMPRLDLLIVDYRLRGEHDGLAVIELVRSRLNQHTPALMITGDTEPRWLLEAERSQIPLLHKPVPTGAAVGEGASHAW